MNPRSPLDDLHVADIQGVTSHRPGWVCGRCGNDHVPSRSWLATFVEERGGTSTVAVCHPCWTEVRTRLENDVFRGRHRPPDANLRGRGGPMPAEA